jgi:NAD(P)-dependent dehydrogenase (short-subunit alcohol dehydrogenase family)
MRTIKPFGRFGTVDILVNGAGGSLREATTAKSLEFFDLDVKTMQKGLALNCLGVLLPCQCIGRELRTGDLA